MKSLLITFVSMVVFIALAASACQSATHNVSTSSALQAALDKAVAGDEIVLANGTYRGEFYIRNNAGTSSSPIVLRAQNLHQAILENTIGCSSEVGLNISRNFWIIQDLRFSNHHDVIRVNTTNNVTIRNNIIENFGQHGVRVVTGVENLLIEKNVIGHGATCTGGSEGAGIVFINSGGTDGVDHSTIRENIVFATGDDGYTFGDKNGYGILIANNSDDNLVQGNLLFANGGKGTLRILGGAAVSTVNRNVIRDNALLWGEGEQSTGDCVDDSNQFVNNIFYSTYQAVWSTKGNFDGTKGNHLLKHNLFYTDAFSRIGAGLVTGGEPFCDNPIVNYKINNTVQDNIFFSPDRQSDFHRTWLVWGDGNPSSPAIKQAGNNLFWAPGTNSLDWVMGYTFRSSDIRDPNKRPVFTKPAEGDFSLASGSPGKNAASDGKDIGIEYNTSLKKSWLKNAFTLPTQQKENLGTSTFFTVNPAKYYQVWLYIPESSPYQGSETFNVEGQSHQRDIRGLTADFTWLQPGGPARWITLGRHRAADGILNISWSNSASASKIFIRELPTTDEAYSWISGASIIIPPTPVPPPTASLAIPGRVEAESFNTGGEGVAYHDTDSANLEGAYRTSEAVDVKLAPDGVGYTIGYIVAGEWLKYNVNVAQSGNYSIALRVANGSTTNGALRIEVDGANVTGKILIPPTGSYGTETTVTGPTISLTQGTHTLQLFMEASNFDLNWIEFTSNAGQTPPAAPSGLLLTVQ